MNVLIGCDPEFFVRSTVTGKSVSAHDLIPGTKKNPFVVPDGAVQVDGMALEFNTDPASRFEDFDTNISSVLASLRGMIPQDLEFDIRPSVVFDDDVLAAAPDMAKELGCDPDYNAYSLAANPRPVPPVPGLRTASGHIHVGLGKFEDWKSPMFFEEMAFFVRIMDRFVGTTSVLMDADPVRRTLYGAAGAFRVKPYGFEYRVPSNAWITDTAKRSEMWTMVQNALTLIESGKADTHTVLDSDVQIAINTSDAAECDAIRSFMLEGCR
jgi:hypothetical protein